MESKIKLLDQMRLVLRLKHMSIRTEDTYVHWVKRFILFHHKQHPQDMGAPEIRAFLGHLALDDHVALVELGAGPIGRDLVGLAGQGVQEVHLELALARQHLEVVDPVDRAGAVRRTEPTGRGARR